MFNKIMNVLGCIDDKRQEKINEEYEQLIDSMITDQTLKAYTSHDWYLKWNFTAFMGLVKNKARIIDFNDTPNFIVVDKEGVRKTDVIRTMTASLIAKNYPKNLQLMIIDTTGEYACFKELPHIFRYASTPEEITEMIDVLIGELNRRHALRQHFNNAAPERLGMNRILFVFDDISSITKIGIADESVEKLADALSVCHKFGIHCILGTNMNITDVLDDEMIEPYRVRILFSAKDAEESKLVLNKAGAESISANEAAMVFRIPKRTGRDDDEPEENFRLKPYHIADSQIEHIVENWKKVPKK